MRKTHFLILNIVVLFFLGSINKSFSNAVVVTNFPELTTELTASLPAATATANITEKKIWETLIATTKKQIKKEIENYIRNQFKEQLWNSFACLLKDYNVDLFRGNGFSLKTPCGTVNFNFGGSIGLKLNFRQLARNIYDEIYDQAMNDIFGGKNDKNKTTIELCKDTENLKGDAKLFCSEYIKSKKSVGNYMSAVYKTNYEKLIKYARNPRKKIIDDGTTSRDKDKDKLTVIDTDIINLPQSELSKKVNNILNTTDKYGDLVGKILENTSTPASIQTILSLLGQKDPESLLRQMDRVILTQGMIASDSLFKFKELGRDALSRMGREEGARAYPIMAKQYVRDAYVKVLAERNIKIRDEVYVFLHKIAIACSDVSGAVDIGIEALMDGGSSIDMSSLKNVECTKVALQALNTLAILETGMTNIMILKALYSMLTTYEFQHYYVDYIKGKKD